MLDDTQKATRKKKMIVAIVVIMSALLLVWISVIALENINKNSGDDTPIDYDFYYADFSENIFEDQEYLALVDGEGIRYLDGSLTTNINESTIGNYGKDVKFFWEFIQCIINGDKDVYNAMFSDEYYKYNKPKQEFTMQKLYDIQISKHSSEEIQDSNGNYTKFVYVVEYRILKNNGTFRNDIGDGARPQYITITNRSGEFLIDSIGYIKY